MTGNWEEYYGSGLKDLLKEAREYEDSLLGIETEDTSGEDLDSIPYSADDIRITPMMYSIYQIFYWIEEKILILQPEYQRNVVWDNRGSNLRIYFYWRDNRIANGDKVLIGKIGGHPY